MACSPERPRSIEALLALAAGIAWDGQQRLALSGERVDRGLNVVHGRRRLRGGKREAREGVAADKALGYTVIHVVTQRPQAMG